MTTDKKILLVLIDFLLIASVFDPSDQILKLKVPIFVIIWVFFFIIRTMSRKKVTLPWNLVFYLSLFIFILPLTSILNFTITNGYYDSYYCFQALKPYLFLTLLVILYIEKINILRPLTNILTFLAVGILIVFTLLSLGFFSYISFDDLATYDIGSMFSIGLRTYGGITFNPIYFKTAPLLVIPVAYYSYLTMTTHGKNIFKNMVLLLINAIALFMTGTRSSIIFSISIPSLTLFYYSKNRLLYSFPLVLVFLILVYIFSDSMKDMFDIDDISNFTKLSYIDDYLKVFQNPKNILIGQGLGTSIYLSSLDVYLAATELTYLDIMRHYGFILGVICILLLTYPFIKHKLYNKEFYLLIAYASYLMMSAVNPFIFSSSGMVVLSAILYRSFSRA